MALRTILTMDENEESLRKHSRPVTVFNTRIHTILDDMKETLENAEGAGLAAPQVGILRRMVVVMKDDGSYVELLNPEIVETEGEQTGPEGCLSLPGVWGEVTRPMTVTVQAMDRYGNQITETASGLTARCMIHECEHLDGILFLDRADHILTDEELEEWDAIEEEEEAAEEMELSEETDDQAETEPVNRKEESV